MLRNLDTLDLSYNGFTGPLPSGIGMVSHLTHMDLSYNNLSGSTGRIPEFLGSLRNLKYLNLSGINFHGRVLPLFGNLTDQRTDASLSFRSC